MDRIPKSQIPNPKFRPGVSIIEVLFAIMITTVGLLGAIALFPVASAQARKARINEAAAAAGRSAVHTFDAIGMRRWERWVGYGQTGDWDVDKNSPPTPISAGPKTISSGQIRMRAEGSPLPWPNTTAISFCIDPRQVANDRDLSGTSNPSRASFFPYYKPQNWAASYPNREPRMFRVSMTAAPTVINPMPALMADSMFQIDDDLVMIRPGIDDVSNLGITGVTNDRSLPAMQRFLSSGSTPLARESLGRLSWMATLVPKVDMSGSQVIESDEYTLSIVVFYDRPADLTIGDPLHERVADVYFVGGGETGGEVLLHIDSAQNNQTAIDQLKLRANDWIMVGANLTKTIPPAGVGGTPIVLSVPRFQWYRITHCDHEPTWGATSPFTTNGYELYATLMGPDWDATSPNLVVPKFANAGFAEATLMEGVIAVYEKTIRRDYSPF